MSDFTRSLVSGRGLAALGRGGGTVPMPAASVPARRPGADGADARLLAAWRPLRERPRRARPRPERAQIVKSLI